MDRWSRHVNLERPKPDRMGEQQRAQSDRQPDQQKRHEPARPDIPRNFEQRQARHEITLGGRENVGEAIAELISQDHRLPRDADQI